MAQNPLDGDEEMPDRSHVFYIQYPETWKKEDIFQVFYHHGGVKVWFLSSTSALCALRDPSKANQVVKIINSPDQSYRNYRIYTYDTYVERFKNK